MSLDQSAGGDAVFEVGTEATAISDGQVSSAERLVIAGEIIAALGEATSAGQVHLMRRVLDVIREEVLWLGLRLTEPGLTAVMAAVVDLEHEVARLAPNPEEFRSRASGVLALLLSTRRAAINGRQLGQRHS
jgi:hypothetical protein